MLRACQLSVFYFLLSIFCVCSAALPMDQENNLKVQEIYRIKIWNLSGGTIEVSFNKGKTWQTQGDVVYPTQKTNPEGYTASRWVGDGKVAATAVNAIHIKTSTASDGAGVVFSLLPKEMLQKPSYYKSFYSPDSSIYTDIPAGTSIFGGGLAPFVGNPVLLSRGDYRIVPFIGYNPALGDRIYIIVDKPVDYPKEMIFENKVGGQVTMTFFSGVVKPIGEVVQPVAGVGRFEGTKYASIGRIRANHPGVIDVSTSRLGKIGGFQIVPSQHAEGMKYAKASPQWLVVGPLTGEASIEGRAPLFSSFIRPVYGQDDLEDENWDQKLLDRFLVEVKLKGGDTWQPPPGYEFDEYNLIGSLPSSANNVLQNVTQIRILFPIEQN